MLKIDWLDLYSYDGWRGCSIYAVSPDAIHDGLPIGHLNDMSPRSADHDQVNNVGAMFITSAVLLVTSRVIVDYDENDFDVYQLKAQISDERAIRHLRNEVFKYKFHSVDIDVSETKIFGTVWSELQHTVKNVPKVNVHDTGNQMQGNFQDRNRIIINDEALDVYFSDGKFHELPCHFKYVRFTLTDAYKKLSSSDVSEMREKYGDWFAQQQNVEEAHCNEQIGAIDYAVKKVEERVSRNGKRGSRRLYGLDRLSTLTVYLHESWDLEYVFKLPAIELARFYANSQKMAKWMNRLRIGNEFQPFGCDKEASFECVEYENSQRMQSHEVHGGGESADSQRHDPIGRNPRRPHGSVSGGDSKSTDSAGTRRSRSPAPERHRPPTQRRPENGHNNGYSRATKDRKRSRDPETNRQRTSKRPERDQGNGYSRGTKERRRSRDPERNQQGPPRRPEKGRSGDTRARGNVPDPQRNQRGPPTTPGKAKDYTKLDVSDEAPIDSTPRQGTDAPPDAQRSGQTNGVQPPAVQDPPPAVQDPPPADAAPANKPGGLMGAAGSAISGAKAAAEMYQKNKAMADLALSLMPGGGLVAQGLNLAANLPST